MKRYMMTMMMALTTWMGANAMDYETAREQAYYLTDKMAYELNLNDEQYNDAYEINLDYLLSINTEADLEDVRYLTYRNADLRHILYDWQWTAFTTIDYLFRPLWWRSGAWYFPVYDYYARTHFFYHRPTIYLTYRGGHGRYYYSHGFYASRRPTWHGGLRGMHRSMVGHPTPGHRYHGTGRHHHEPLTHHRGDNHHTPNVHHNPGGHHNPSGHHNPDHHHGLGSSHGSSSHHGTSGFRGGLADRNDHNSSSPRSGGISSSRPNSSNGSRGGFSGSTRSNSFSGSSRGGSSRGSGFSGGSRSSSGSRGGGGFSGGGSSRGGGGSHRGGHR